MATRVPSSMGRTQPMYVVGSFARFKHGILPTLVAIVPNFLLIFGCFHPDCRVDRETPRPCKRARGIHVSEEQFDEILGGPHDPLGDLMQSLDAGEGESLVAAVDYLRDLLSFEPHTSSLGPAALARDGHFEKWNLHQPDVSLLTRTVAAPGQGFGGGNPRPHLAHEGALRRLDRMERDFQLDVLVPCNAREKNPYPRTKCIHGHLCRVRFLESAFEWAWSSIGRCCGFARVQRSYRLHCTGCLPSVGGGRCQLVPHGSCQTLDLLHPELADSLPRSQIVHYVVYPRLLAPWMDRGAEVPAVISHHSDRGGPMW